MLVVNFLQRVPIEKTITTMIHTHHVTAWLVRFENVFICLYVYNEWRGNTWLHTLLSLFHDDRVEKTITASWIQQEVVAMLHSTNITEHTNAAST